MRLEIICFDIDDAIKKLTDLKEDYEWVESDVTGEPGESLLTEWGKVEFD